MNMVGLAALDPPYTLSGEPRRFVAKRRRDTIPSIAATKNQRTIPKTGKE
jgi:hypothetical protein